MSNLFIFILLYFILSNILPGCYNWYQSKSFENVLIILGLVGSELSMWLLLLFLCLILNCRKVNPLISGAEVGVTICC